VNRAKKTIRHTDSAMLRPAMLKAIAILRRKSTTPAPWHLRVELVALRSAVAHDRGDPPVAVEV